MAGYFHLPVQVSTRVIVEKALVSTFTNPHANGPSQGNPPEGSGTTLGRAARLTACH